MKSLLSSIALATALTGGVVEGAEVVKIQQRTVDGTTHIFTESETISPQLQAIINRNNKVESNANTAKLITGVLGTGLIIGAGGLALKRRKRNKQDIANTRYIEIADIEPVDNGSIIPPAFSPEAWKLYSAMRSMGVLHEANVGGHLFHLSDRYIGERQNLLGFVLLNGKYHARYFYLSSSGGNWHCAPAFHGRTVSKGDIHNSDGSYGISMSYENGTIVHDDLSKILDNLPISSHKPPADILGNDSELFNKGQFHQEEYTQLYSGDNAKRILRELADDKISVTPLILDTRAFAELFGEDSNIHYTMSPDEYISYFENIPVPYGVIDNLKFLRAGKIWKHTQLGISVSSELYQSKFLGKNIIIEYATGSDQPNNPWIENIYFQDATISTWGFLREQINPGILRTKPIEYISQCPKHIQDTGVRYDNYIDIREYTQGNPLISQYKNLKK